MNNPQIDQQIIVNYYHKTKNFTFIIIFLIHNQSFNQFF